MGCAEFALQRGRWAFMQEEWHEQKCKAAGRAERVREKAHSQGLGGVGGQVTRLAGRSGYHPTGNGEPKQGWESWKVNSGERQATGGPRERQRQQDQAVPRVPIGGNQTSKRHGAPRPPNIQCCLLSTRPQSLNHLKSGKYDSS